MSKNPRTTTTAARKREAPNRYSSHTRNLFGGALAAASLLVANTAPGQAKVFTLDGDFDQGELFNVNHDAPNNDQLQLNLVFQSLPIMYVANAAEDTVSKIDTDTGREIARYRTGFGPSGQPGHQSHPNNAFAGPAPSRTAVDADGNCYVANRRFDGRPIDIVKILASGGIDRNNNGQIDTSTDLDSNGVISGAEILPMGDANNDGVIDDNEIGDERIAWVRLVGPSNGLGRSLSIAPDGNLWVGDYNNQAYYEMDGNTGAVLGGPYTMNAFHRPYGSLVDSSGTLWGASLSNTMLELDTSNPASHTIRTHPASNYGIAIGNGRVYLGRAGSPYREYNPGTGIFTDPGAGISTLGISTDANGDILVSGSSVSGAFRGASKLRPDGSVIWSKGSQAGANGGGQRGAIVDSNGDVWTINVNDDNISKFRGTDGVALGVFPVGDAPYTYSDASGASQIQQNPVGRWTVVCDTGQQGTEGCVFEWTAAEPGNSTITVEVDASDTFDEVSEFDLNALTPVSNGGGAAVAGQYVLVQVTFTPDEDDRPVLFDLSITCNQPPVANCNDIEVANLPGECFGEVPPDIIADGSSDPDGDDITIEVDPLGPYPVGTTPVTVTVTDPFGLSSSCQATVTVIDAERPTITCPEDIVVANDPGECGAVVRFARPRVSDNCGVASLRCTPPSGSFFDVGTTTVVCVVTDTAGNQARCAFDITVEDREAPVIECPPDQVLECPADTSVAANGSAGADDNCGVIDLFHFDDVIPGCGNTVTVLRTWVAVDAAGNVAECTQTIEEVDTTPPEITSDAHDILPKDAPITFTVSTSDACGEVTLAPLTVTCHKVKKDGSIVDKSESCVIEIDGNTVTIVDSGGVENIITIFAAATDECGNTSDGEFVVNVLRPANEGVGNGVDGDTPGHDNNGGNDDPGQTPGNPGAKGKKN